MPLTETTVLTEVFLCVRRGRCERKKTVGAIQAATESCNLIRPLTEATVPTEVL